MAGIRQSIGDTASNVWSTIAHPFSKKDELSRYKGTLPKNEKFIIVKRNIFQRFSKKNKSINNFSSYKINTINAQGDYNRTSKYDTLSLNSGSSEEVATAQPGPTHISNDERPADNTSYYDDIQSTIANCCDSGDTQQSHQNALHIDITPELKRDQSRYKKIENLNYYDDEEDDVGLYQEIDFHDQTKINFTTKNEEIFEPNSSTSKEGLFVKHNQPSRQSNDLVIVANNNEEPQILYTNPQASNNIDHHGDTSSSSISINVPDAKTNQSEKLSTFHDETNHSDEETFKELPSTSRNQTDEETFDTPDGSLAEHQRLAMESVVKINVIKEEVYFLYQQVTSLIDGHVGSRRDFLRLEEQLKKTFIKLRKVTSHGSGEVRQYRTEAVLETKRILKNLRRYIQTQDQAHRNRQQQKNTVE